MSLFLSVISVNTEEAAKEFLENPEPAVTAVLSSVAVVILSIVIFYIYVLVSKKPLALNPEQWRKFQLVKKTSLSHNVVRLKFALQTPTTVLGLPIGQHISIQGVDDSGKEFMRPYTPITLDTDVGIVEFVIKLYPEGLMSKYLDKAQEGSLVAMRGPKGRFKYSQNMVRHVGMIGGGSGITPMFQVARAILEDPQDKTKISLISANVTEEDILLREELDGFARDFPGRFSVYYVLNKAPEVWKGGVGFVTKDILQAQLPGPAEDIKVLYCGPPPMNKAMQAALEDLGYKSDMLFKF